MTEPRGVTIEVVEDERVAGRGTARTHWLVRQGDGWIRVAEFPGAETELLRGGPGTVWERAVRLLVPEGTELSRVEVRPRPDVPRDPLAYLERDSSRAPKITRRTYYSARAGGRLDRKKPTT